MSILFYLLHSIHDRQQKTCYFHLKFSSKSPIKLLGIFLLPLIYWPALLSSQRKQQVIKLILLSGLIVLCLDSVFKKVALSYVNCYQYYLDFIFNFLRPLKHQVTLKSKCSSGQLTKFKISGHTTFFYLNLLIIFRIISGDPMTQVNFREKKYYLYIYKTLFFYFLFYFGMTILCFHTPTEVFLSLMITSFTEYFLTEYCLFFLINEE